MFGDPNLWSLRYLQSFNSANIGLLFPPIAPFLTQEFSDRYLRIRVTSSEAKSNWTYAGFVSAIVNAGGVDASVQSLSLRLDESKIFEIDPEFTNYKIKVSFPRYFKQATISIFGYTGNL